MTKKIIKCTDDNIKQIVEEQIELLGNGADLNHLDVSDATDMSGLFENIKYSGRIHNWNVSKVTNMSRMFKNSAFNSILYKWDVSKVTNMSEMFANSKFDCPILDWKTSKVKNMERMFSNAKFKDNISKWKVYNSTNIEGVFDNCPIPDKHKFNPMIDKTYIKQDEEDKDLSFEEYADRVGEITDKIKSFVKGQDQAIETISDHLISIRNKRSKDSPQGVFLFVGPPGTGKTYLSKMMSEHLPYYNNIEVFDMSSYQTDNDISDLVGSSNTYTNSTPGRLTSSVAQYPKSIIVFDEFEKANTNVQNVLLPLFSEGRLRDNFRKEGLSNKTNDNDEGSKSAWSHLEPYFNDKGILEVDFSESVIIITSNLGREVYSNPDFTSMLKRDYLTAKSMILDSFSREGSNQQDNSRHYPHFTPPMVSRLNEASIVMFNKLNFNNLLELSSKYISDSKENFEDNIGRKLEITHNEEVLKILLLSLGPNFDTRNIKGSIPKNLPFDLITDEILKQDRDDLRGLSNIRLEVIDSVRQELKSIISKYEDITREFFRKNLKLSFKSETYIKSDTLVISIKLIEIKKVERVVDFNDDFGFVIEAPKVDFDMVKGHGHVKDKLKEIIKLLKQPEQVIKHGITFPKGLLLYGVPGTGKTMLAKAVAKEADLPFIATTGTNIINKGVEGVNSLFEKARNYAPCIIFIDEIDSIPSREARPDLKYVVNQLLTEIDGFKNKPEEPVFIIAATNNKKAIDGALIRSGRIAHHIEMLRLDKEARGFFINSMLEHEAFDQTQINSENIVRLTVGMSGADLERVKRDSLLEMIRLGRNEVTNELLIEQINVINYGQRIKKDNFDLKLEETAIHEAGHLVVSWYLTPEREIQQITVAARANFLGAVISSNERKVSVTRDEYINDICVSLAGREAEIIKYKEAGINTGASSDLESAILKANYAISRLGMDDSLYNIAPAYIYNNTELFSNQRELAIKKWIDNATNKTKKILNENWEDVENIANAVLEKEVLYLDDIKAILEKKAIN